MHERFRSELLVRVRLTANGFAAFGSTAIEQAFELALLSDVGTNRPDNEDSCGHLIEGPDSVVFAVADGVGGYEGGEIASRMAVEITARSLSRESARMGRGQAAASRGQRANIEIHDMALTVPELSRMATTLTAVAVENGILVGGAHRRLPAVFDS